MTVYQDNAAGRLYRLIEGFRNNVSQSQQSIPNAWAAALNISAGPSPGLLSRLSYLLKLPDEIKHEIGLVDDEEYDSDLALRWYQTIQGQMSTLFTGNQAVQVATAMNDSVLSSLEYCSVVLHRHRPQRVLSSDELTHVHDLIRELEEEVEGNEEIGDSLQEFLLQRAFEMSRALSELGLRGPAALEDALDQAVGATHRRIDLTTRMEENKTAWTKFQNLIIGVAAVLQIATSSLVLPGQVRQELDGPAPTQPSVVKVIEVSPLAPGLVAPKAEKVPEGQGAG